VAYPLNRLARDPEATGDRAVAVAAYREVRATDEALVAKNPKDSTAASDLKEATEALARLGAR
jgi:hypothetical protein